MKGEINKNYYCVAEYNGTTNDCISPIHQDGRGKCELDLCPLYRRKWPTPEQFKEEYGADYRDDCPAWFVSKDDSGIDWALVNYGYTKRFDNMFVVCACTPWGKPPAGWRQE